MDKNVFGYLLITKNSMNKLDAIVKDYWNSITAMERENAANKKNYSCCIVCVTCSWWFRRKLAKKIGIPMKKIYNAKFLQSPKGRYDGFDIIIATDSMVDDTFYGRTKVYDNENNIPRAEMNRCIDVVYDA